MSGRDRTLTAAETRPTLDRHNHFAAIFYDPADLISRPDHRARIDHDALRLRVRRIPRIPALAIVPLDPDSTRTRLVAPLLLGQRYRCCRCLPQAGFSERKDVGLDAGRKSERAIRWRETDVVAADVIGRQRAREVAAAATAAPASSAVRWPAPPAMTATAPPVRSAAATALIAMVETAAATAPAS